MVEIKTPEMMTTALISLPFILIALAMITNSDITGAERVLMSLAGLMLIITLVMTFLPKKSG